MNDFFSLFSTPSTQPQGSMFGGAQQQQSPLMQLLGIGGGAGAMGASNPGMQQMQLAQQLMAMGSQQPQMPGMPPRSPMGMTGPMPHQGGQVPSTLDQNSLLRQNIPGTMDNDMWLQGMPPQNPGAPNAFGGIPPEILRMLMTPKAI